MIFVANALRLTKGEFALIDTAWDMHRQIGDRSTGRWRHGRSLNLHRHIFGLAPARGNFALFPIERKPKGISEGAKRSFGGVRLGGFGCLFVRLPHCEGYAFGHAEPFTDDCTAPGPYRDPYLRGIDRKVSMAASIWDSR